MNIPARFLSTVLTLAVATPLCNQTSSADEPTRVTVNNFNRAESDLYFSRFVKDGGFGKFDH